MSKLQEQENPFSLLEAWFQEAKTTSLKDPNAVLLSTLSEDGFPRSRVVLAKQIDKDGVIIYTNYESDKGRSIDNHNKVSLTFYWEPLGKQIRIAGTAKRTSREVSEAYWNSRPKGSQVSQYISQQSLELESRQQLERAYQEAEQEFCDKAVPCPQHWGGYLITPVEFEFWCADERRLHDRMIFRRNSEQNWLGQRLYP